MRYAPPAAPQFHDAPKSGSASRWQSACRKTLRMNHLPPSLTNHFYWKLDHTLVLSGEIVQLSPDGRALISFDESMTTAHLDVKIQNDSGQRGIVEQPGNPTLLISPKNVREAAKQVRAVHGIDPTNVSAIRLGRRAGRPERRGVGIHFRHDLPERVDRHAAEAAAAFDEMRLTIARMTFSSPRWPGEHNRSAAPSSDPAARSDTSRDP